MNVSVDEKILIHSYSFFTAKKKVVSSSTK